MTDLINALVSEQPRPQRDMLGIIVCLWQAITVSARLHPKAEDENNEAEKSAFDKSNFNWWFWLRSKGPQTFVPSLKYIKLNCYVVNYEWMN